MKKILFVGVMIFAFALTMNVAFASTTCGGFFQPKCPCPDVTNVSTGDNVISSKVNTGKNVVLGGGMFSFSGVTSGVGIAETEGVNAVNTNLSVNTRSMVVSNKSYGNNVITSKVNTGNNMVVGNGVVTSGGGQASTKGINLVNTNVSLNTCGCQTNGCQCPR